MPNSVEIKDFEGVREAWKCPHLSARMGDSGEELGPSYELFLRGTVIQLDGAEHVKRRRTYGQLIRGGGHKEFRDTWLFPVVDSSVRELHANPDEDGFARVEVYRWIRRVQMQLAAALVGFDEAREPEGAEELADLMTILMAGRPTQYEMTVVGHDEESAALKATVGARDEILERFFRPNLERRLELVRRLEAGEISEEDLPKDLTMLIARRADPAWEDPALAEREVLLLLAGSVHTTSSAVMWTLREIFAWLEEHPDEESRLEDDDFILGAAREALRLHPVAPASPRLAVEDVELKSGAEIPDGAIALIRSGFASTEPSIYGEDAMEFNPDREVPPGIYEFGFAFGTGSHMCYGLPIVMGTNGLDGSLGYMLKAMLGAGARPDPEAPMPPVGPTRGDYDDATNHPPPFHVIFDVGSQQAAAAGR
jgi:cytochrome P450